MSRPVLLRTMGRPTAAVLAWLVASAASLTAQDDLTQREEQALRAAAQRVAGSVVSIETVGGLERAGRVLFGTGPTTGLIVSDDGYIISSAFNFAKKPTSILVGMPDGTRTPAKLVATDHSRMLVLLKIGVEDKLAVPEAAQQNEFMVGQWAIAVGRTFDAQELNMSVGIVSATQRIWGKAVQTDAKVSPANYGGALVDIHGRVMGVLVPLSPDKTGEVAGVEWYDSGIGFAVPLEHVNRVLPRLQEGKDLHPGMMGVSLKSGHVYSGVPEIAACRPNSPAYKAGFKAGDKIVEIEGQAIDREVRLRQIINERYAGDKIKVVALRGEERIERELVLIDKLDPYRRPFLGMLPMRDAGQDAGVVVRYVYPDSPAAKAKLSPGDVITAMNGQALKNRDDMIARLNSVEFNQPVQLDVSRGSESLQVTLKPAAEPEAVPDSLPPARSRENPPAGDENTKDAPGTPKPNRPQLGMFNVKIPEKENNCVAYVPEDYNPRIGYGMVVWLHGSGDFDGEKLVERWKPICQRDDLILLAPVSVDPVNWKGSDSQFVRQVIDEMVSTYNVDAQRVVAHGVQGGGAMAYVVAFGNQDAIRGVAAVNSNMGGQPPENDPIYRLSFYITTAKESTFAKQVETGIANLRKLMYAVTVRDQGQQGRYLNDDELAEMLRWIDSLDRL